MVQLTLTEIRIYPVKSLGGISLTKGVVQKKGLQFDRRWMLIDKDGIAMTQRDRPEMALFRLAIDGDNLQVTFKKPDSRDSKRVISLSTKPDNPPIAANIWNDKVEVVEVNVETSQWFSNLLGTSARLVAFPENNARPVDPRYAVGNDHVSLADAYPFLIIGESSLNDLNERLPEPVPMNRFRPNFVFRGGTPFAEDEWKDLAIGNVRFAAVKKSARCVLITVNQDTAEKGPEPLRTLSTFRKVDNNVFFGQNMIALDEGVVAVGDAIIPG